MSTIVLETSGKNDNVQCVTVHIFPTKEEAVKFCSEKTDSLKDEKYWRYAEIIDPGVEYEPARYKNYK